ncbi:hypothetical protein VPH35_125694 [Triticum aestivum]|uniref:uncharacterized protein n=1 Tax=Triticum aestivum TaxID=4565 RepID=UPI001D024C29|nr:uncharacterized protein LOC123149264 [Triticum aestivum]
MSCLISLPSKQLALCRFHWPLQGEAASLTTVPHTISPGVSRRIEHRLPAARGVHRNRIRRREARLPLLAAVSQGDPNPMRRSRMPDRRGAAVIDDLPDDIIFGKILITLPPKDIGRCRMVRTSWRSATFTPEFMAEYRRRQPSTAAQFRHPP